jgi:hypothetical protein
MYPVIAVGVQLLLPLTVTLMVVLALRLPEVPFTVMVAVPEAELLAEILMVVPLTLAETPEFELEAVRVALDAPEIEIESVVLEPAATVTEEEAGVSERLPPPLTVTLIEVLALNDPEVPLTVMVAVPEAELLAEMLMVLPLTVALTPEFELVAVSVALEAPETEIASVVLEPAAIVTEAEAGVSERLPPLEDTVGDPVPRTMPRPLVPM